MAASVGARVDSFGVAGILSFSFGNLKLVFRGFSIVAPCGWFSSSRFRRSPLPWVGVFTGVNIRVVQSPIFAVMPLKMAVVSSWGGLYLW